jgi:leucyl-tRNA---protein transferase
MEFRDKYNKLIGVILLDVNDTTLSAVYSFFEPNYKQIGLGNFMISQCLIYGKKNNFKYLYLGYYISHITSMAYKIRFRPGQILDNSEWKDY